MRKKHERLLIQRTEYYAEEERKTNADLTLIKDVAWFALLFFNVFWVLKFNRKMDTKIESLIERAKGFFFDQKAALIDMYNIEKEDFAQGLPLILQNTLAKTIESAKMSTLGQMSGVSRQLKGLETEMLGDGIAASTGIPSGIVTKYLKKYPLLAQMLPAIAQKMSQGRGQGATSSNPYRR